MGALPPLGRFKGFAKGEIEIPLCRPFLFTVNGFFFPALGKKKGLNRSPRLRRGHPSGETGKEDRTSVRSSFARYCGCFSKYRRRPSISAAWSRRSGRPDTAATPIMLPPRRRMGKPPPQAA